MPTRHRGPFLPPELVIGGYVEIEVDTLEDAVRIAGSWPARGALEIRPMADAGGRADRP